MIKLIIRTLRIFYIAIYLLIDVKSVSFVLHLDYSNSSSTVCTVLLPLINLTLYQTLLPVTYTVDVLKLAILHIVLSLYVTIFIFHFFFRSTVEIHKDTNLIIEM